MVVPIQILFIPAIGAIKGVTTTILFDTESVQPAKFVTIYLTVTVPPKIPVTVPALSIVAIEELLLTQTPPLIVSAKTIVLLTHTESNPAIAEITGKALTVRIVKTESVQPFFTM